MDVLSRLVPVSETYATLPIADAFNWQDAGVDLDIGEWYLVAFRSIRKPGADEALLFAYDELAHQEAARAPGFVHYFKGPEAPDGSCLSFCLWQSRAEARSAAGGPAHVQAVGLLNQMYAAYALEFHRVARKAAGPLTFEPYDRAPQASDASGLADHPATQRPIRPAIAF